MGFQPLVSTTVWAKDRSSNDGLGKAPGIRTISCAPRHLLCLHGVINMGVSPTVHILIYLYHLFWGEVAL